MNRLELPLVWRLPFSYCKTHRNIVIYLVIHTTWSKSFLQMHTNFDSVGHAESNDSWVWLKLDLFCGNCAQYNLYYTGHHLLTYWVSAWKYSVIPHERRHSIVKDGRGTLRGHNPTTTDIFHKFSLQYGHVRERLIHVVACLHTRCFEYLTSLFL